MDNLAEILGALGTLGVGGLAVWVKVLRDEVASLRKSRHQHGNFITGLQGDVEDIERRLEKMGNGERRG